MHINNTKAIFQKKSLFIIYLCTNILNIQASFLKPSLENFPPELLIEILKHTKDVNTLLSLRAVSKKLEKSSYAFPYNKKIIKRWGYLLRDKRMLAEIAVKRNHPFVLSMLLKSTGQNLVDPLITAAKKGNEKLVKMLLKHPKVNPNATGAYNYPTALHHVAELGLVNIMKILLQSATDINVRDRYHRTPLYSAVNSGHAKIVELLLQHNADISIFTCGTSPFHLAAHLGNIDILKLFLKHKVDINTRDKHKWTPLHSAVNTGNLKIINFLLQFKPEINPLNNRGETPHARALKNGYFKIAKHLEKYGAYSPPKSLFDFLCEAISKDQMSLFKNFLNPTIVNFKNNDDQTLLHVVLSQRDVNLEALKLLLQKGANVNATDKDGETPLHFASAIHHLFPISLPDPVIINILLEYGADPNIGDSSRNTPLHKAVFTGYPMVVGYLLNLPNVNVNAKNYFNCTPLHFAAENKNPFMIQVLLAHGAKVNVVDKEGETPLHFAAHAQHPQIISILLNHGADINIKSKRGLTPLHIAVLRECHATVACLLKYPKINLNAKNYFNCTPLHFAAENKNPSMIQVLLAHGAKVNVVDKEGETPLHFAAHAQHPQIISILLNHGADINIKSKKGLTPLHIAVLRECHATVACLLKHTKIDLNAKNMAGKTPLDWAIETNQNIILEMLRKAGAK